MLTITTNWRHSGYKRMTRTVLCGFVAAVGILLLSASAQAQTVSIASTTVTPTGFIPRLDALPQITAAARTAPRVAKPFLYPMDPVTFAAAKADAERVRV